MLCNVLDITVLKFLQYKSGMRPWHWCRKAAHRDHWSCKGL